MDDNPNKKLKTFNLPVEGNCQVFRFNKKK